MADQIDGRYSLTSPAIMDFPNLFVPKAFKGKGGKESGEPKYKANLVLNTDHPDLTGLKQKAAAVAKARWPDRKLSELAFPFTSGTKLADKAKEKKKDGEHMRDKVVIAGRSKFAPGLAGIENGRIVDYEDEAMKIKAKPKFYAGVEVLAEFNFVAYEGVGANPDGVTAYLNKVLSLNKGTKLNRGSTAAEAFKGYAGTISAEDPTGGKSADLDDEIAF